MEGRLERRVVSGQGAMSPEICRRHTHRNEGDARGGVTRNSQGAEVSGRNVEASQVLLITSLFCGSRCVPRPPQYYSGLAVTWVDICACDWVSMGELKSVCDEREVANGGGRWLSI